MRADGARADAIGDGHAIQTCRLTFADSSPYGAVNRRNSARHPLCGSAKSPLPREAAAGLYVRRSSAVGHDSQPFTAPPIALGDAIPLVAYAVVLAVGGRGHPSEERVT